MFRRKSLAELWEGEMPGLPQNGAHGGDVLWLNVDEKSRNIFSPGRGYFVSFLYISSSEKLCYFQKLIHLVLTCI